MAIYGLREDGNDLENIYRLLFVLYCDGRVSSYARIGRSKEHGRSDGKSKLRLLKITMESEVDCKALLAFAKYLKEDTKYASVY